MSVVKFFFDRMQNAMQLDMANKLNGKPTYYWIVADEWMTAYTRTLSNKEKASFDKEYAQLEKDLEFTRLMNEGNKEKWARKQAYG